MLSRKRGYGGPEGLIGESGKSVQLLDGLLSQRSESEKKSESFQQGGVPDWVLKTEKEKRITLVITSYL